MVGELSKTLMVKMWRKRRGLNVAWLIKEQPMLTPNIALKKFSKYVEAGYLIPDGEDYRFSLIRRVSKKEK